MTAEEVARLHQFREGFTLVDYGEVGLPVFRLTIEAVTTAYRALPTIQEFAMRCMATGIDREDEIARMLGLEQELVAVAVDLLIGQRYVVRQVGYAECPAYRLTETGQARLDQELEEFPQEEMLVIDYDGVMRTPVRLAGTSVVRASELKTAGAVEIRPYPAEPPSVEELAIREVTKVIRRQGGEDFRRTVLALKRIVRRYNVFREAVALVFAADRGSAIQVAFAIDGKLSEAHERSFAQHGGPKKMGFLKSVAGTDARRRLNRLIGREAIRSYPERSELIALRREEAEAEAQVRSLEPAGRNAKPGSPPAQALRSADERLAVARHEIHTIPTRPLACYEQSALLDEAVRTADKSLIITSAGLQPLFVDGFFLRQLDVLARSARILIETPLGAQVGEYRKNVADPVTELAKRSEKGQLELRRGPRRDLFFLIKDDDLAVVSNRPFLGEQSRRAGFIRIDGFVTRDPSHVRAVREAVLASSREAKRA